VTKVRLAAEGALHFRSDPWNSVAYSSLRLGAVVFQQFVVVRSPPNPLVVPSCMSDAAHILSTTCLANLFSMTWDDAASLGPHYIAYRIDEDGVIYFRYHFGQTIAIVLGRHYRIENVFDDCEDWQPFREDALPEHKLEEVRLGVAASAK
jgi:hypothetical protein